MEKDIKQVLETLLDYHVNKKEIDFKEEGFENSSETLPFKCSINRKRPYEVYFHNKMNSHGWLTVFAAQSSESQILYFTSPENKYLIMSLFLSNTKGNEIDAENDQAVLEKIQMMQKQLYKGTMDILDVSKLDEKKWDEDSFSEYYYPRSVFSKIYQLVEGNEGTMELPKNVDFLADFEEAVELYEEALLWNAPTECVNDASGIEFDHNIILYGPPGTGKTYRTAIYAVAIFLGVSVKDLERQSYDFIMHIYNRLKKENIIALTTFHQSYGYEEFIEGIMPETDENGNILYSQKDGVFKAFCKAAGADVRKLPRIFIIDEINRGNISKIFGELITLLEDTKREGMPQALSVTLPYTGETFSVPNNVYIIGTMNTADRSIALMDTALRRRFQFEEMMPEPAVLKGVTICGKDPSIKLDVSDMLATINNRIEYLYDREHMIGHAFFVKLKEIEGDEEKLKCLGNIFRKSVIPLLQEYFFEDYRNIQYVLGDNGKQWKDRFLREKHSSNAWEQQNIRDMIFKKDAPDFISEEGMEDELLAVQYEINDKAFDCLESYLQI